MADLENAYSQAESSRLNNFMQGAATQGDKWLEAAPTTQAPEPKVVNAEAPPVGAITYGYQQGKATFGIGAHNLVTGVNNMISGGDETTQRGRVKGAAQILEGLFQMGLSPVVGTASAIGDTLDKIAPSLSKSNILNEGQVPGVIRTMLNPFGSIATMLESPESIAKMSDEQLKEFRKKIGDYSKPFTFREAVETGVSMAIPIAIAAKLKAKKEGEKVTPEDQTLTPEDAQSFVDKVKAQPPEAVTPPPASKPLAINWDDVGSQASVDRVMKKANAIRPEDITNFNLNRLITETDLPTLQGYKATLDAQVTNAISKSKGFNDPDVNASFALAKVAQDRIEQLTKGVPDEAPMTPLEVTATVARMNAEQPSETTAAMMQRLNDTVGVGSGRSWGNKFWEASKRGVNAGFEYWMGSMLSSPRTWAKKAISDEGMMLTAVPERVLMRVNHQLFFADAIDGTAAGEAGAMAKGWLTGVKTVIGAIANKDALQDLPGADVYTVKPNEANPTGIVQRQWGEPAITADKLGVDRIPILAGATDLAGSIVRIGPNVLKNITRIEAARNFQMENAAQVVRQAHVETAQAAKAVEFLGGHADPVSYSKHVADRIQWITDNNEKYPSIERASVDAANYRTFMRPLGPRAEAFFEWMDGTPLRVNMPFYRVPINFGKEAAYMFPPTWIASRIWGEMGREWEAGGARRESALAKLEMGAMITGAMASWTMLGRSTGGGPTDPGLREAWIGSGRRPYTIYPNGIKPGAEGVSLHNIAPWGLVAGAVQDIGEIWGQIPSGTDLADKALNIGAALTLGVVKSIDSEPMFQGWANFLNAVHQPLLNLNTYLKGLASSAIPAGWKAIQSTYLDQSVKEVRDPLDRLRADVWRPGAIDRKDHITGEPILYPSGLGPDIVSPFTLSEIKKDVVAQEFWDSQIRIQRLPWVVAGTKNPAEFIQVGPTMPTEGIPISGPQRDRWIDIMTKEIQVGGLNLHDKLQQTILSSKYQMLPKGPESQARQDALLPIITNYRERARLQLLKEDAQLRVDAQIHQEMQLRNQLPMTNPKATGIFNSVGGR